MDGGAQKHVYKNSPIVGIMRRNFSCASPILLLDRLYFPAGPHSFARFMSRVSHHASLMLSSEDQMLQDRCVLYHVTAIWVRCSWDAEPSLARKVSSELCEVCLGWCWLGSASGSPPVLWGCMQPLTTGRFVTIMGPKLYRIRSASRSNQAFEKTLSSDLPRYSAAGNHHDLSSPWPYFDLRDLRVDPCPQECLLCPS